MILSYQYALNIYDDDACVCVDGKASSMVVNTCLGHKHDFFSRGRIWPIVEIRISKGKTNQNNNFVISECALLHFGLQSLPICFCKKLLQYTKPRYTPIIKS